MGMRIYGESEKALWNLMFTWAIAIVICGDRSERVANWTFTKELIIKYMEMEEGIMYIKLVHRRIFCWVATTCDQPEIRISRRAYKAKRLASIAWAVQITLTDQAKNVERTQYWNNAYFMRDRCRTKNHCSISWIAQLWNLCRERENNVC